MEELLDWDGVWSPDLISAMLPVAIEQETKREQAWNRAAEAAIASVFSKGDVGRKYKESLEKVLRLVKEDQLANRGGGRALDRHATAAQKLVDSVLGMLDRK
jgi:hypothetical protein